MTIMSPSHYPLPLSTTSEPIVLPSATEPVERADGRDFVSSDTGSGVRIGHLRWSSGTA